MEKNKLNLIRLTKNQEGINSMDVIYISLFVFLLAVTFVLVRSYYEITHFKIKRYKFKSDKVTENAKFAFLSDLHNCRYGDENKKITEAIISENVDFLILGGDLIYGKKVLAGTHPESCFQNATDFINDISKKVLTYYVYGNHETRMKNRIPKNRLYTAYMESIKDAGIVHLNDKTSKLHDKGIVIAGNEICEEAYDKKNKTKFELCKNVSDFEKDTFNILVSHAPDFFDEYCKTGADVVLCGHNHGGTVRLPFIGGIVTRDFKLFPKYSYGIYEKNNTKMILTAGLGDHTIHFRLFNRPEIVIIEIERDK